MKKTTQISVVNGRVLFVALAVGAMATLFSVAAPAATVGDLLKFLPPSAQAAVGVPDIAGVEEAGAPLLALPFLSEISTLAVQLGGDTLSEGLSNSGIDVNAPCVAFVQLGVANEVNGCGVLMVKDAAKVKETLISLLGGEGSALPIGDLEGRFVEGSGVAYMLQDDKLFVASTQELLKELAGRIAEPAAINYGKDGVKDEVVAFSRIDIIEQSNLLTTMPVLAMLKPILDIIKPFSDEVIMAIGENAGKAYVRVAARDIGNAPIVAPAPLALHGFMDSQAPVVMNLRITPELINAASMSLMNNPATRQVGGYIRIASALLDNELAVSFSGMKNETVPEAVIAAKVKNPGSVPNLLQMIAKIEAPSYKLGENDVYVYPNVTEGTDLHIATAGQTLVVTPGEEALKTAVDRFSATEAGTGVNQDVVNRGVYGFMMIDGAKAKNLPEGVIPENINLDDISLALTMGVDGEWREIVLTSPAGFSGIADIVGDVM